MHELVILVVIKKKTKNKELRFFERWISFPVTDPVMINPGLSSNKPENDTV